jgi:hypothetical protein
MPDENDNETPHTQRTHMHPTQHSTIRRSQNGLKPELRTTEPRILRTHRLITKGVSEVQGDDFVKQAVEGLQTLASKAAAKPLQLAPPAQGSLKELLAKAAQTARPFTPRKPQPTEGRAA